MYTTYAKIYIAFSKASEHFIYTNRCKPKVYRVMYPPYTVARPRQREKKGMGLPNIAQ